MADSKLFASLNTPKSKKAAAEEDAVEKGVAAEVAEETKENDEDLDDDIDLDETGATEMDASDIVIPNTSVEVDLVAVARRQADILGVTYKDADSADLIAYKVELAMAANEAAAGVGSTIATATTAVETKSDGKPEVTLRQKIWLEEMKLVRVRITNMDDKDKNLGGDWYSVSNDYIGDVIKFIPYGNATEEGYHIPYCIYKQIRDQKFVQIYRHTVNGVDQTRTRMANKFAIEILPDLTKAELRELGQRQLATGSLKDD